MTNYSGINDAFVDFSSNKNCFVFEMRVEIVKFPRNTKCPNEAKEDGLLGNYNDVSLYCEIE